MSKTDINSNTILPERYPWLTISKSPDNLADTYGIKLSDKISIAWARLIRWEFWHQNIFYAPIIIWVLWLGIRYRCFTLFTASNPALELGGLVGEQKHLCLLPLQENTPDLVARTVYLQADSVENRIKLVKSFIAEAKEQNKEFPIVLKPNIGQRGRGVFIARNLNDVTTYLQNFSGDLIVQQYVSGQEFGVFVMRQPSNDKVEILSIVHKSFPHIVADGVSALSQLILNDKRARLIAPTLYKRWQKAWHKIPAIGEKIELVEIGAHCRGSLFEDAGYLGGPELAKALVRVCDALPGYHFGRIDLRAPSKENLQKGDNLSIMEVNGVSAESAHIYHPGSSLFSAYKIMFQQWAYAFAIGKANQKYYSNHPTLSVKEVSFSELRKAIIEDSIRDRQWF